MSHQPFDTWLIDATNLTPEQKAALLAHLETCPECRNLQAGWQAAQRALQTASMTSPKPGFSQRFSASLLERRARQAHRRQIRNLILGLSLGLVATAAILGWVIFTVTSPVDLLVRATETVTRVVMVWNDVQGIMFSALQQPIILVIWILVTSGMSLLVIGWLFTLWRISLQGAHHNEQAD